MEVLEPEFCVLSVFENEAETRLFSSLCEISTVFQQVTKVRVEK